jgi:nitronate monooxygenase
MTAESAGSGDFTSLWAGQGTPLGRSLPAGELTPLLGRKATVLLGGRL